MRPRQKSWFSCQYIVRRRHIDSFGVLARPLRKQVTILVQYGDHASNFLATSQQSAELMIVRLTAAWQSRGHHKARWHCRWIGLPNRTQSLGCPRLELHGGGPLCKWLSVSLASERSFYRLGRIIMSPCYRAAQPSSGPHDTCACTGAGGYQYLHSSRRVLRAYVAKL